MDCHENPTDFLAMTEKTQNLIVDCHENPTDFLAMTQKSILPTPLIPLRKGGGKF
ncbi:hypothetical protein ACWIUD_09620 [Helicobacter sp. 23-1044]